MQLVNRIKRQGVVNIVSYIFIVINRQGVVNLTSPPVTRPTFILPNIPSRDSGEEASESGNSRTDEDRDGFTVIIFIRAWDYRSHALLVCCSIPVPKMREHFLVLENGFDNVEV